MADLEHLEEHGRHDEAKLDSSIGILRARIKALTRRRAVLRSALLSSPAIVSRLEQAKASSQDPMPVVDRALDAARRQRRHNTTSLHRVCAGITAFLAQDPDPNAVDGGKILGVRIEDFSNGNGRFERPHYVLLHRPWHRGHRGGWKVKHHTLPQYIDVSGLERLWLRRGEGKEGGGGKQDLGRFARELRRAVMGWRLRAEAVRKVEKEAVGHGGVMTVERTDDSCREIRFAWENGASGKISIAYNGKIDGVVVLGAAGRRNRKTERMILGGDGHIGGLAEKLASGVT